jgi:hypothetical protein
MSTRKCIWGRFLLLLQITIFMLWALSTDASFSQDINKGSAPTNVDSLWAAYMEQGKESEAVDDLIVRLQNELASPTKITNTNIDFWPDAVLRSRVFKFAEIAKSASGELRSALDTLSSPVREFAVIILGLQSDSSVKGDLRIIIATSGNPTARELAAYSLAAFMDRNDIPLFKEALADTFWVTKHWDYILEDGRDSETYYPIRDIAAEALRSMGFQVTHDFSGNYTILREPKW